VQDLLASVAVVIGWFSALGLVGALIWVKVTPLPGFTRVAESGSMGEEELAKQFAINGWFLVIAASAGLLSGLALMLLRRTSPPLVMIVLVALGGGLATVVMLQGGLVWGPGDPNAGLAGAALGEVVPIQLKPDVDAVYFAWSIAALIGAAAAVWVLESRESRRARLAEQTASKADLPIVIS